MLVAIKEQLQDNYFIRTVPKEMLPEGVEVPIGFNTQSMCCDHCHTVRNRNEVFLVYNTETEDYAQIGRTCLHDYLGMDVSGWLARAEWILDIEDLYSVAEMYSSSHKHHAARHLPFDTLFAYVYTHAGRHGFISKKKAMEDESVEATVHAAIRNYYDSKVGIRNSRQKENPPTPEEIGGARKLLEWFRTELLEQPENRLFGDDLMWQNLKNAYDSNMLPLKFTGLVGIPYACWLRHESNMIRMASRKVSQWVGEIGKKTTQRVKCVHKHLIDSNYGPVTVLKFVTPEGNVLCWFQSSGSTLVIQEEDELTIVGMVKEHKEYNNQKETVVKGVKQLA